MDNHEVVLRDGKKMHARIVGSGDTLVLLHGIPGSGAVWDRVAEKLEDTNRLIIPDLFGFGESSRSRSIDDLWTESQADGVIALLDDLGETHFHVAAHDFGGPIASALYRRVPERFKSLTLASTNLFGDTPIPFPLSGVVAPVIGGLWSRLLFSAFSLGMMVKKGIGSDPPANIDTTKYVGDREQATAIRIIFTAALRELTERYGPVTEAFRDCTLPSQVLWGDKDAFFSVDQGRRSAELLGTERFTVLDGAGHFLPEERPQEMADAIRTLCGEKTEQ